MRRLPSYDELMSIMAILEGHYRDLCDIEFTIERGKLWMLQTRVGKRTAAAFCIATQLVDEGLIDLDEALTRVTGAELVRLMFPAFDTGAGVTVIATGVSASPGAAVGKAVFDSARAVELAAAGEAAILVRRETNPDDLNGMIAAKGILTSRGGKTSHAAVVARGMGKPCVCGAEQLDVDTSAKRFTAPAGITIAEGDVISIDGTSGLRGVRLDLVIPGLFGMQVRAIAHAAAQLKRAGKDPRPEIETPLVTAVQEMEAARGLTERALREVEEETGVHLHIPIGTMIEVPRGALTAGSIAGSAEFFSFGTNDLTQMTWGFSRDDVEAAFFGKYLQLGIFGVSPFETIDREGVGQLIEFAVRKGRAARPGHGGVPHRVDHYREPGAHRIVDMLVGEQLPRIC